MFRVGSKVRVIAEHSYYAGLVGKLIEITRFGDAGMVEFSTHTLESSMEPKRVTGSRVHFYFRELERIKA